MCRVSYRASQEPGEDDLSFGPAAFKRCMRCFQIGSVDRAHMFAQRGADAARVDHFRNATQQVVLGKHVRFWILGSREH